MGSLSLDALLVEISAALTAPARASESATVITQAAVDLLPGVQSASICVSQSTGDLDIVAPTDPLALEADRLQQQLEEGPTWDALATSVWTCSADVARDERWPLYGPKVAASGCAAQVAAPLHTGAKTQAVLNLYSSATDSLDDLGVAGRLFASHAAVAWCGAVQLRDLSEALGRRKMIGQAVGIVMERYGVAEEAAFAFLTRASQTANLKLRDVAAQIVASPADRSRSRR